MTDDIAPKIIEITPQAVKDLSAKVLAHYQRAEAMLTYADQSFDKAITLIESLPTEQLRFKFDGSTCIVPFAPIAQIQECLAGGGSVSAVVEMKAVKWPATKQALQSSWQMVQITECTETEAKIICDLPGVDVIKNPKQTILFTALQWIGG